MNQRNQILLLTTLFLILNFWASAQNCTNVIKDDRIISGTHILKTNPVTLVVRGNYTYSIMLMSDSKGITAKMFSKGGVSFNQDDEIIFMDNTSQRKSYRFIETGELKRGKGTPTYENILALDMAAIKWFATSNINTIYIKNNISNEMRKFTVNQSRQTDFRVGAVCFNNTIDKDKIVATAPASTSIGSPKTSKSSNAPISATRPSGSKPTNIKDLNDKELADLYAELRATKERVKQEIQAEKDKGEQAKATLREEVALARELADAEKKKFANEVLEARKNSQAEIARRNQNRKRKTRTRKA